MRYFVYILTETKNFTLHCGWCIDIVKAIELYSKIPCLYYDPHRINVLVYLEELVTEQGVTSRFNEINSLTMIEKTKLVQSINPDWVELKPGINFEI